MRAALWLALSSPFTPQAEVRGINVQENFGPGAFTPQAKVRGINVQENFGPEDKTEEGRGVIGVSEDQSCIKRKNSIHLISYINEKLSPGASSSRTTIVGFSCSSASFFFAIILSFIHVK